MSHLRCTRCNYRGPSQSFVVGAVYGEPPRCRFCRATAVPTQHVVMAGADTSDAGASAQNVSVLGVATPSDVRAAKDRLNPYVVQMSAAMASCAAKVPAAMQAAWTAWAANWSKFYLESSSVVTASADMDHVKQSRVELTSFENQLLRVCPSAGIVSLEAEPPSTLQRIGNALPTIAVVGLVVGGAVAIYFIYRGTRAAERIAPHALAAGPKMVSASGEAAGKLLPAAALL